MTAERRGAQNINYTVYNITMKTGRVEYICKNYIKYMNCVDTTEPTHPLSPRGWLCLLLSYYFQPYLVTEFSFNKEAQRSIRLKSWFVNASFKGTSKTERIFKEPFPLAPSAELSSRELPGAASQQQRVWMRACVCRGRVLFPIKSGIRFMSAGACLR